MLIGSLDGFCVTCSFPKVAVFPFGKGLIAERRESLTPLCHDRGCGSTDGLPSKECSVFALGIEIRLYVHGGAGADCFAACHSEQMSQELRLLTAKSLVGIT
jgi:hypothetical protein